MANAAGGWLARLVSFANLKSGNRALLIRAWMNHAVGDRRRERSDTMRQCCRTRRMSRMPPRHSLRSILAAALIALTMVYPLAAQAEERPVSGDLIRKPSIERARELLKAAGYKNERVVYMQPADSALINPIGLVVMDRMRQAGFNLDVQTSDWSSITQRWVKKAPLDQGGWSVVPVIYVGFDMANPLGNPGNRL